MLGAFTARPPRLIAETSCRRFSNFILPCIARIAAYNFWYRMADVAKKLEVLFFATETGNEPVREWLLSLARDERKTIGEDILKVQYCWPIGKPLVGTLGNGLWEVRSRLVGRISRVIFCVEDQTMILLHGFIKKTQKTPKHELDLATKRKKQLE